MADMGTTEMALTVNAIDAAMKGNAFWLDAGSEQARIVGEATRRGFIRRASHTQVEWTEAGLAKARAELAAPQSADAQAAGTALVALNIATTLKGMGVVVVNVSIGALGLRVDVRGVKAQARKALEALNAAGLREGRMLNERRGLWLVVGHLAA